MEHLAIMKKSWGLTRKILTGEKTIESRWYKVRYPPWDRINPGEVVYFKDTGEPVRIRAEVERVMKFSGLTPRAVRDILDKYGREDGLGTDDIPGYLEIFKGKRYCMLIFLKNPREVEPFDIDKTGYGAMSAWITVDDINRIRKTNPREAAKSSLPCQAWARNRCLLQESR